jgi:hypothetical protein
MGFGRGLLLWLLGIPIPIIILLAIFWQIVLCPSVSSMVDPCNEL